MDNIATHEAVRYLRDLADKIEDGRIQLIEVTHERVLSKIQDDEYGCIRIEPTRAVVDTFRWMLSPEPPFQDAPG